MLGHPVEQGAYRRQGKAALQGAAASRLGTGSSQRNYSSPLALKLHADPGDLRGKDHRKSATTRIAIEDSRAPEIILES